MTTSLKEETPNKFHYPTLIDWRKTELSGYFVLIRIPETLPNNTDGVDCSRVFFRPSLISLFILKNLPQGRNVSTDGGMLALQVPDLYSKISPEHYRVCPIPNKQ